MLSPALPCQEFMTIEAGFTLLTSLLQDVVVDHGAFVLWSLPAALALSS